MNTFLRWMLQTAAVLGAMFASAVPGAALTNNITAPVDGTTFATVTSTSGITITGGMVKTNGYALTSLTLKANNSTIATLTTGLGAWSYTWYPTAPGAYVITATAVETNTTDTSVTNTLSTSVSVTVNKVNLLTIQSPTSGSNIPLNSQLFLRANAIASDQQIQKVEYFIDGVSVGSVSKAPYNLSVTFNQAVGARTLKATATLSDGTTQFDSANVALNIIPALGQRPQVAVTSPIGGDSVAVNQNVTLAATASDADGFIPSTAGGGVTFFVDGEQVGTSATNPDLVAPYTLTWQPTVAKTYSIVAQAIDDKGNTTHSTAVEITASSTIPAVAISSPANNSTQTVQSPVTITANASGGGSAAVTQVEFFANGVSIGTDTTSPYSVDWTPAAVGTYSLTARIKDANNATVLSSAVNVNVVAAPPTVSITAPAAGATLSYAVPTTISATAAAGTNALGVTQVEFFVNGVSIGIDATAPYSIAWTPSTVGNANLTAKVTDTNGTVVTSPTVAVTVSGTRLVTILAPTANASIPGGSSVFFRANVSFTDGSVIERVDFLLDDVVVGTAARAPYNYLHKFAAVGADTTVTLKARVTTSSGTTTDSLAQTINLVKAVGSAPTVALTGPSVADPFAVGQSITVTATASDSDGFIPITAPGGVTFYVDGDPISPGTGESNPDLSAPYSITWKPALPKKYELRAITVDDKGNQSVSEKLEVTVQSVVPTVSLTSPANNSSITAGNSVNLVASAAGGGGVGVKRVDFYENGAFVAAATTAPYSVTWTPSTVGSRQLTARVTDNNDLTATSATINVTILAAPASVSITSPLPGATVAHAAATTVTAIANAATGNTITQVEFFLGSTSLGVDTTGPNYSVSWTPFTTGNFSLTAKATDNTGAIITSSAANVTVSSTRVVTLTNPVNGATIPQGSSLYTRANVVLGDGSILQEVEFLVNGVALPTPVRKAPYNQIIAFNTLGAVTLQAKATTSDAVSTYSPIYTVNVVAPVGNGPTITLTEPSAADSLSVNQNITVAANASDADGFIPGTSGGGVTFLVDGDPIAAASGETNPDLSAPYSVTWKPATAKSYVLTAFTTDDKGNMRLSAPVTVNVLSSVPSVAISSPSNNSSVAANATVNITASASGANGAAVTKVDFFDNGAAIGSAAASPYTVAWVPTVVGPHVLTARVTDSNGLTVLSNEVTVNVTAATVPTVAITSPVANATLAHATPVIITANAGAPTGASVTQVEFFAAGVSLGVDASAPYSVTWTPLTTGSVSLTAKVTDSNGATATSTAVAVTVSGARVVTLASPANNATYPANSTIFVRAAVSFSDGAPIQQVEFFNGATSLGIVSQAPYSLPVTFTAAGAYNLRARATATDGSFQDSATYVVNVVPAVGTAPTVRITAPTGTTSAVVNTAITITAEASDVDGYIPTTTGGGVTFFVDGEPLGGTNPDLTAPYSISWTPGTVKTYTLVAQAVDDKGNVSQSAPVMVSVVGAAPTVTITSPSNNANVAMGTLVNLVANPVMGASASPIARVDFYDNGILIGTSFAPPYSFGWTPSTVGTHPITAKVTDANGASAISSTVNVIVVGSTSTIVLSTPSAGTSLLYNSPTSLIATVTAGAGVRITQVDFLANGILVGSTTTAPYGITWTPIVTGSVSLTARLYDSNGGIVTSSAVNVSVSLSTNPPTISLALAGGGSSATTSSVRYLVATASDDGAIDYVEFFANGASLGQVNTAPYVWPFNVPATPGIIQFTAKAVDNAGNATTSSAITLNVSPAIGEPPTVSLISPSANSFLGVNSTVTISANATDADGTVTQVQFFQNGTSIATDTTAPFSTSWTPTTPGTYTLTAIATDSRGNSSLAAAVPVTVVDSTAPSISITTNPSGTIIPINTTRYITATASASSGHALDHVEFYLDGVKVAEDSVAPFTYRYTAQGTRGFQTIVARAIDNAGLARDASVTFEVLPSVGSAPSVILIGPAANTTVAPGTPVQLAAQAQDADGNNTVTSVQFFVDGTQVGSTDTSSPYTSSFTPTLPGAYVIEALATDEKGNNTVSKSVSITAVYATPTIKIVSPLNNARLTIDTTVAVNAQAIGGNNSGISSIEYFLDGALIGVRTSSPFSISWTPDASLIGEHTITAKVTDANSNTATSAPITVTVSNAVGKVPTVNMIGLSNNATVQSLSTLNLLATAFDSDGSITSVEFFVDYERVGQGQRLQTSNNWRLTYAFPEDAFVGSHTIFAAAKDNSGNLIASTPITVNLVTSSSVAPSVDYLAATPDTVIAGQQLTITAEATDPDGSVNTVQFWANGTLIGNATQAPYIVTFTPTTAGRYTVWAVAVDDTGNSVNTPTTVTVNVTGNTAPTIVLTRPSDNALTGTVGQAVFLEATASDPDIGQTITVDFIANGLVVASGTRVGTTNVYRATSWTPSLANTYQVAARATDSSRGSSTTSFRRVTITNLQGLAPTITLSVPSTATTASVVPIAASAADIDGSVAAVEFFVNGGSIGKGVRDQLSNNYRTTYSFGALGPGTYPVVAVVTDNMGNNVGSSTANITINSGSSTAPNISMKATPTAQSIGQTVELTANAFDPEGGTLTIQYYANGTQIGSSSNAGTSYNVSWTPSISGDYNFYAIASDSSSNSNVSATIKVTVKSSNPMVESDAFIIQAYQDLIFDTPNNVELTAVSRELANGTLTKAGLVARLAARTEYDPTTNLLTAYWLLMGEWPSYENFQTLQSTARSSLPNAIGQILALPEYALKWADQPPPTTTTFNGAVPLGYEPRKAFVNRLYQGAYKRNATELEILQFKSQDQNLTYLARGYDSVGINSTISELITKQFSVNPAFAATSKQVEAAGLYYVMLLAQPSTAQVNTLAALSSLEAVATELLKDPSYSYRWVTITEQPKSLTVFAGSGALFYVEAVGLPPLTYQWLYNGSPIQGATNRFLSLTNVRGSEAGNYSVRVNSSVGSATSDQALLQLSNQPSRLGNISTRGLVGGSNELIAGFVAAGTGTRQMLIRAVGPTLAANGLSGAVSDVQLDVYRGSTILASNDNWGTQATGATLGTAQQLAQVSTRVGAFSLPNNSRDAAVLITLQPGPYTVRVRGVGNAAGVALVEVYDTSTVISPTVKATNVSTRGMVGTGDNVLIAGFYVGGSVSRRVLIRGIGPSLATYGVANPIANPRISLHEDIGGTIILENDDWGTQAEAPVIRQAANQAGAFAINNNSRDAAIIVMLKPGLYTVQMSGVGGLTGPGLIEVYDVD